MLEILVFMNSAVEEILNFKTCCGPMVFDQNLEIHLTNTSDRPIVVPSRFDLIGDSGPRRIDYLTPNGDQKILPGETIAFYCQMDEDRWNAARRLVFYDREGREYPLDLKASKTEGRRNGNN